MQHVRAKNNFNCRFFYHKLLEHQQFSLPKAVNVKRDRQSSPSKLEAPPPKRLVMDSNSSTSEAKPASESPATRRSCPNDDVEQDDDGYVLADPDEDEDDVCSYFDAASDVSVTDLAGELEIESVTDVELVIEDPKQAETAAETAQEMPASSRIRNLFADYLANAGKHFAWMDPDFEAAVRLMHLLDKCGAPFGLYNSIMQWHMNNPDTKKVISKDELLKRLKKRYNMVKTEPQLVKTTLPSNQVEVKIPCQDTWAMIMDLLTEPKLQKEDYLWFNDSPNNPPPTDENWTYIKDLNDGLAYRKTYDKLIRPNPITESGRRKVLLPVILYMDGCVTGFNENLSIELVKFTFGIFNSKARSKDYTWRNLGAVPQFLKVKAKAAESLEKSEHLDARGYLSACESDSDSDGSVRKSNEMYDRQRYVRANGHGEEPTDIATPCTHLQDLHNILQVILGGFKSICSLECGFEWDLFYNKIEYKVQFIPYISFFKGDTVEHDKLTGRFGPRTKGIKSLCRYCVCPSADTDSPYKDHIRKNPAMLSKLVRKKDLVGLKNLSQHNIFNVFYDLPFGLHNDLGIHGACPMDLLHWLQLGKHKYSRSSFFEQTGKGTEMSRAINTIAAQMGYLFKRQSDRNLPRTKFSKGLQKGKLMAHEMSGVILVLVAVLTSTAGRNAIMKSSPNQKSNFPTEEAIDLWIATLELHLQFEQWLKLPELRVDTVLRMRTKIRELMLVTKEVQKRESGMGFRTNCFHSTKHVPDDILFFGPPHCVNTDCNESHHKPDKKSAQRTQKRPENFELQVSQRIEDRRAVEMGIEELEGRPRWDYPEDFQRENRNKSKIFLQAELKQANTSTKKPKKYPLTGVSTHFSYCEGESRYVGKVRSQMKRKNKFVYPKYIEGAIADVAAEVDEYLPFGLTVFTEYDHPNDVRYRASPYYQGKPWYDWAICRRPGAGEGFNDQVLPVHLRGFVDLRDLPAQNTTKYAPGIYFIGENVIPNPDIHFHHISQLFVPYLKVQGHNLGNKMVIQSVNDILGATCVIPDIAHPSKRAFFQLIPRQEWPDMLEHWVHSPFLQEHNEPPIV